ncbi:hypothetical protein [Pseudomonas sp. QTF5]|uniref:hypothetical protein n=1 Tax=Pseudomonas sp. QTF5 TaxID=1435425 RepID=UPI0004AEE842|nr:hypothetical protein [Pseudomonas sp. QTF5]
MLKKHGAIPESVKRTPLSMLTQVAPQPDPERLLRAVHAQNLKALNTSVKNTTHAPRPASRVPGFFPQERWPVEVPAPEEPGFYIVPKSISAEKLEAQLFPSPNPSVLTKFRTLNPNLDLVKAGSMIVLSAPNNQQCTYEESLLMQTAQIVSAVLEPLTVEEADFMAQHYGVIQTALSDESKVIGVTTAIAANHLDGVKTILKDIENLHTNTLEANGSLNSKKFKKQRARLLKNLDGQLTKLTKKTIGLPDYPNLKTALGIDHPHLVHRWRKAGGIGQIPGYATHIQAVTKASQYVKYGGWIGTAVGGSASAMKVEDVCRNGSTEACQKVKFTETGSFLGGVGGGALTGAILTAPMVATICVGIGVPTGGLGTVICGAIVAGTGSYAGGIIGEKGGEEFAEIIYEVVK